MARISSSVRKNRQSEMLRVKLASKHWKKKTKINLVRFPKYEEQVLFRICRWMKEHLQKQPFRSVHQNNSFEELRHLYTKTPTMISVFSRVAGQSYRRSRKRTQSQVLFIELFKIFQNSFLDSKTSGRLLLQLFSFTEKKATTTAFFLRIFQNLQNKYSSLNDFFWLI